jgi:acyl carrier protein
MSPHTTQIQDLVTDVLVETLGLDPADIVPDADLQHDLGLDSLDRLELITGVEGRVGVTVPDSELASIRTVADATAMLERHAAAALAGA